MSRYQKGKTNLDFTEARDSEWQWHQLGRIKVCTSLQKDNHASTPYSIFYRPDALPAAQPTASKHWRQRLPTCLHFNSHLPDEPDLADISPQFSSSIYPFRDRWHKLLWAECLPVTQPTVSKHEHRTQTDFNHWPYLILSSFSTTFPMEKVLHPSCRLSNASTSTNWWQYGLSYVMYHHCTISSLISPTPCKINETNVEGYCLPMILDQWMKVQETTADFI